MNTAFEIHVPQQEIDRRKELLNSWAEFKNPRPPVFVFVDSPFYCKVAGIDLKDIYRDPEAMVRVRRGCLKGNSLRATQQQWRFGKAAPTQYAGIGRVGGAGTPFQYIAMQIVQAKGIGQLGAYGVRRVVAVFCEPGIVA